MTLRMLLGCYLTATLVLTAVLVVSFLHRNDRSLICKENTVGGQVYADNCIRK